MRPPALIHAPLGEDAEAIARLVEASGEESRICVTTDDLAAAIENKGAEASLLCVISQEGAGAATGEILARALSLEPIWARLPLIFVVQDVRRPPPAVRMLDAKENASPFLVLDRPCRPTTLRHAIENQAESRRRQFETRDLLTRLQAEEERTRFLLSELRHRTSNSLAVLQALFGMSARQAGSVDALSAAFGERLQALAAAYARLSEDGEDDRQLDLLLREHVHPYAPSADQLHLSGPPAVLARGQVLFDLAMVVHELATNAAKYGAMSRPEGRVEIEWGLEDAALRLVWRERGGPPVEPPEESGLGMRLLRLFPSTEPSAEIRFEPAGVVWIGRLPPQSFKLP